MWVISAEAAEVAEVAMVVYGDSGNSGQIMLGVAGEGNMFLKGNKDEFKVRYLIYFQQSFSYTEAKHNDCTLCLVTVVQVIM